VHCATSHNMLCCAVLCAAGDAEMMGLAERLRERFPGLLAAPYAPRRYPIISTQVCWQAGHRNPTRH
jgi:hypothetical protein